VTFQKYDQKGAYHWAWADRRSRSYEPAAEARYAVVAQRLGAEHRVLDIGCGDGYLMSLAAKHGARPTGLDSDRTGLNLARRMLGEPLKRRVLRADAQSVPFAAGAFDRVLLVDVIEHLPDPASCVNSCARVLAKNGRLLVTTPKWRPGPMWDAEHHVREYRPEELASLLEGFFDHVRLSFFISKRWWEVRRTLGKGFMRAWSKFLYNPFGAEGSDPSRFCHMLAVCAEPRPR
jgi:2-polyprenyl-3-methyl-5-hydroxy-6-metoxy-1,4-benzoquinol methylase